MSQTQDLLETLKANLGKLELRGEEVWMCGGGTDDGLRWDRVLTADQLWAAIDQARGVAPTPAP
jgi:hypothetical protein